MALIETLEDCPTDIIGDIHGEFHALESLLYTLGYSRNGDHVEGRKLVFTGDLVDRGPDSPAVMNRIIQLVERGVAHCVLGNHELNILRSVHKGGNNWVLDAGKSEGQLAGQLMATEMQASKFIEFINTLPFALIGPHLRVVHACWDSKAIAALADMQSSEPDIGELYRQTESHIVEKMRSLPVAQRKLLEVEKYSAHLLDPQWNAHTLPAHAEVDMALQMENPLRVLTTSEEVIASKPFWAAGKWRMTERCPWWNDYDSNVPVVIGHFWRMFNDDARRITGMFGADVFDGISSHAWMGKNSNVYCVDYSVGQRHLERKQESGVAFHGKLAALRYPEWEVVHDDGSVVAIGAPGLQH